MNDLFHSKDGEFMFNRCCRRCKCQRQRHFINPCCIPVEPEQNCIDCGLTVTSTASTNIARVCSEVTYTVTVTNNSDVTVRNAILMVPLDCSLAILTNSVTVNGQVVEVENLDQIVNGDIEPGATYTITYVAVVMEYKRCIYTRAIVAFCACCCFERKIINVSSEPNLLQVCSCCFTQNNT